jgi:hypothetical protein
MQVTFTNLSAAPVYLSALMTSLDPSKSVTTRRTTGDLDREQNLKVYIQTGVIQLAFAMEAGDGADLGFNPSSPTYSNTTRPAAATVPAFTMIFNTDDHTLNLSDGVNWRDGAGNIT